VPALYLAQSLLFLILLAFLVFLGTEVSQVGQLVMRGALFLVSALFFLFTAWIGLARGGISSGLRRIYAGVSFLFLLILAAVQGTRAIEIYPRARRTERVTDWFPMLKRRAWWEEVRGPLHEFEYLLATLAILLIALAVFLIALRRLPRRGPRTETSEVP
jgi:hypothetical protein